MALPQVQTKAPPKQGARPTSKRRTATTVKPSLQERYETATASLLEHFAPIDSWLAEHAPHLWQLIRQEDDELFNLRQVGASDFVYRTRMTVLLSLYQQAEQLYYEAHPEQLPLPALASEERVAIYFTFADGTISKVNSEGPA
jgi:hypothetical protein